VRAKIPGARIIGFPRAAGTELGRYLDAVAVDAVGLDWTIELEFARSMIQKRRPVQGNLLHWQRASNPKRRIGCKVISAARLASKQRSRKPAAFSRKARYSGRYLPACRISQSGGIGSRSLASTRSNGLRTKEAVTLLP
jgi:hypothetical protein